MTGQFETLQEHTDKYIRQVLDACGSPTKAAKALGVGRATLYRWISGSGLKGPNRDTITTRERKAIRLAVLQEVFTAWSDAGNNGKFTQWLMKQLKQDR